MPGSPEITPFFDRRFVIVTGKGGVGKSMVCAGIALAARRRGKHVLVCELNTRERISRLFEVPEVGPVIREVHPGIEAVNMGPEEALREYGLLKFRVKALLRAVFENRVVRGLLRIVPGIPELVLVGKAWYHEQERDPATGKPRFDMVVVDAPATGHGLPFLRIPQVVLGLFPVGPLAEDARRIRSLLVDPSRTSLNIVALPEEMPFREAQELKAQVDAHLGIPSGVLFINQVIPSLLEPAEEEDFRTLCHGYRGNDPVVRAMCQAASRLSRRRKEQGRYLAALRAMGMPCVLIPALRLPHIGREAVERVADAIEAGISSLEGAAPQKMRLPARADRAAVAS